MIDMKAMQQVARKIDADATLLGAWQLQGGISAQMTALEVRLGDGRTRKMIVRRPGAWAVQQNPNAAVPNAATEEFRILQIVQRVGVRSQKPYLLDSAGDIFPEPYLVIEYLEGEPVYAPADANDCVWQMAQELARLHTLGGMAESSMAESGTVIDLAFLPQQMARLNQKIAQRPVTLDHTLDEGRIRDALERVWPLPPLARPALLHGDFWPGNLLWQAGKLVAVIDWEDAEAGNPLADVATTRLDILWLYGEEAMQTFTHHYRQLTRFDFTTLPYWDLVAALRPAGRLHIWAEGWPTLGRSDLTEEKMRAGHRAFVDQAFDYLWRL